MNKFKVGERYIVRHNTIEREFLKEVIVEEISPNGSYVLFQKSPHRLSQTGWYSISEWTIQDTLPSRIIFPSGSN